MGRPGRLRIHTTDPWHAATFYTGGFRMVAARRRRSALLGDHTQQPFLVQPLVDFSEQQRIVL